MSGLHRRASSAALYGPVIGEPGDITESFASATPRGRTGSFSADNTRPASKDDSLDELEEKEAFIPTTRYDRPGRGSLGWRSVDASNRGRRRRGGAGWGWKVRLILLAIIGGAVGGGIWYLFFRDGAPDSVDDAKSWLSQYAPPWWSSSNSSSAAADAEASGLANLKVDAATSVFADQHAAATSGFAQATKAAASYKGSYGAGDDAYTDDEEDSLLVDSEEDDNTVPSSLKTAVAAGAFSSATSHLVSQLLDNGTLAAYKWHETLPTLKSSSLLSSLGKDDGRLIVAGDLHGTHRSLLSLLRRISFSPSSDTLLHVGDVVGKSSLNDSLTTVSLLRKLGARGVRGNHDQKVLEWRKWMEAYGPLNQTASSSSVIAGTGVKAQPGANRAADALGGPAGFRKVHQGAAAAKLGAPRAARAAPKPRMRKVRRGWMSWLTGQSDDEDAENAAAPRIAETQDEVEQAFAAEEQYGETRDFGRLGDESEPTSAGKAKGKGSFWPDDSSSTTTTGGARRPFGRPTSLSSVSRSSTRTSSSSAARATSTAARVSSAAATTPSVSEYDSTGALVGALYAHLDPKLSSTQRAKLGLVVPEGWEWGGDHFDVARHLSSKDVEYLEQLPLTLYVDEIKNYVVHAGMVPWTSLDKTLARTSASSSTSSSSKNKASSVPAVLDSTTPLSFSPSSSLSRLLSTSSPRTALLLEELNTSPFTLLNMRTLSRVGGAPRPGSKVKGPPSEWSVSSKGRKASKGSQPWWAVWEQGMKECAEKNDADDESACEEVGVLYGHWAGQGLQVQDHSIGLDTGCVYGRRLSALVVPLSSSAASSSKSPLSSTASTSSSLLSTLKSSTHNLTASASHRVLDQNATLSSANLSSPFKAAASKVSSDEDADEAEEDASAPTDTGSRARPNWHGGMQRVKASSSSASVSLSSTTTSAPSATATRASSFAADLAEAFGPSSDDEDALEPAFAAPLAGKEEEEAEEEDRPWWRPWKRAPPQGRPGQAPWHAGEAELDDDDGESGSDYYGDEDDVSSTASTTTRTAKPTKGASGVAAAAKAVKSAAAAVLESDDAQEADEVASLLAEDGDEGALDERAFAEEKVALAAVGGKVAWVVSVDCAGETDIE
ncbi:hypothetical protein Rhopal_007179-T1 [Rhodotorula paludigena]|uniref:Calcineurin-like phosphoesterase domain-containing protein n=1 Tax=Rhodotorula paludigena TaxID=86838 RepID=A0AAV5GVX7_9BASI|nr:hypothetical protein Rhopal_007179-T1 [Rhodotorula paludigena]